MTLYASRTCDAAAICRRMREAREALGLSQQALADAIGGSKRGIQENEAQRSVPGGEVICGLVRLGINANWLLTGEGPMMLDPARELARLMRAARGQTNPLQLAEWLERPVSTVQGWESGAALPDEATLREFARHCAVDAGPLVRLLRQCEDGEHAPFEPESPSNAATAGLDTLLLEDVTRYFFDWLRAHPDKSAHIEPRRHAALIALLYKIAAVRGNVHEPELDQMMRAVVG